MELIREDGPATDRVQHFHDHRLVRPSQVQGEYADRSDPGELADRPGGIRASGAGQSHRCAGVSLHGDTTEGHSGSDLADGLRRLRVLLLQGSAELANA